MKDNKIMPKRRGIYAAIAKKHGVTRQNVRDSILSGSDKYASDFVAMYNERINAVKQVIELLTKEVA